MALLVARIAAAFVVAYLLGGVPWALVVGKVFYASDPRLHGSGNLGATNVFRVLGARAGIATLLLDAAKGSAAVYAATLLVPLDVGTLTHEWVSVLAMCAAVLGHSYSPYIKFGGGKGVATSAGGLLVLAPLATVVALVLFVAVVALSRMVSLGSVVVALVYPLLALVVYPDELPLLITIFGLAALVLWRHRANISRIVKGEESKISMSGRGSGRSQRKGSGT